MDDSTVTVAFDDWLYRQDEKHVFNLTKIKKFGILYLDLPQAVSRLSWLSSQIQTV